MNIHEQTPKVGLNLEGADRIVSLNFSECMNLRQDTTTLELKPLPQDMKVMGRHYSTPVTTLADFFSKEREEIECL